MGFFSRLFGASSGPHESSTDSDESSSGSPAAEAVFQIPWGSEATIGDCELQDPRVLLADVEGLTASNIAPLRDLCRRAGKPLAVVTPGVDRSFLQLLSEGDLVAIKATDLPGQPVRNLLADVAVIAGGNVLLKELGFGLDFPESLSQLAQQAQQGICVPDLSCESLTLNSLFRVHGIIINREGTEFRWPKITPGRQRDVQAYTAVILREEPTPGRDERLRRLCTAAACLPDKAKAEALLHTDFSAEYPLGLASPYFVTEPSTLECRLDEAFLAVFGEPLNDLELLVRLLGRVAVDGRALLILAPSVSDEALAICVVNKLRGILLSAMAVPRTQSPETAGMLADIAQRAGAQVVTQSDARRLQGQGFLGRTATVRVTCDGMTLTQS
jgi:hypothetical protein